MLHTAPSAPSPMPKPWYREPYVWMIVGGPLVVIVASMVTLFLAIKYPDPVVKRSEVPPQVQSEADAESAARERGLLPAGVARNHAASPTLPKD